MNDTQGRYNTLPSVIIVRESTVGKFVNMNIDVRFKDDSSSGMSGSVMSRLDIYKGLLKSKMDCSALFCCKCYS